MDLEQDAPRLSALVRKRLIEPGVLLVVTIRLDGTPRLSPVEPLLLDGDVWLSMMWHSHKAADLIRDDRIRLHSITTTRDGREGEAKLRGRAINVIDPDQRNQYRDAVAVLGWRPEEPNFHLFRIDISDATFIRYEANGDQRVTRWPQHEEFIRHATSPTSVGRAEPVSDLLDPD